MGMLFVPTDKTEHKYNKKCRSNVFEINKNCLLPKSILQFMNINRQSNLEINAIRNRTVKIIIFRTIVEKIV